MAVGVKSWSTTASSNANADANINWAENQLAPTLNNSARATLAAIAALYDQIGGGTTVGGSSNAYTITNAATGAWSAYATGDLIMLIANHTNSGAATLNVDGLGTKAITKNGTTALASGDLQSGGAYLMTYDGTRFVLVGEVSSGVYQTLDATLTALSAILTGAGKVPYATGTDTVSEADSTSYGRSLWNVADEAAFKALVNLEVGTDVQGYDADTAKTDVAADWSAAQAIGMRVSAETSGTLTSASANKLLQLTDGITLPNSVFSAGQGHIIDPGTSSRTITRGSGIAMYVNGADASSATVPAGQVCGAVWRSASVVVLTGPVS